MDTSALAFGYLTVPAGEPFQRVAGIGRSQQYDLIAAGEIESVLVGRRRLIIMSSYAAYLERQRQKEAAGEIGVPSPNPRAGRRQPKAVATIERPQGSRPRQQYRIQPATAGSLKTTSSVSQKKAAPLRAGR